MLVKAAYEALIGAGANFASSPRRVFIHIFDPVLIIEKIAYTSIKEVVTADEVVGGTVTGSDGIGGIETRRPIPFGLSLHIKALRSSLKTIFGNGTIHHQKKTTEIFRGFLPILQVLYT